MDHLKRLLAASVAVAVVGWAWQAHGQCTGIFPAQTACGNASGSPAPPKAVSFNALLSPQALTRVNDTNVTVTLGGTPATALLQGVSLTLGWTGTLAPVRGGTGSDLSATGGPNQVLQQTTVGGNITVGQLSASNISGITANIATFLGTPSSANLRGAVTDESGTGALLFQSGDLGTPSAGVLTNATGLPIATGVSGLGANVATFLATPSSANLASAVTGETGTGALVFATTPTLVTPVLGAATATSINGLTITSSTGTLTVAAAKTATFSNSITFAGTDATTQTFPSVTSSLAALTIEDQALSGGVVVTSKNQGTVSAGTFNSDCGDRPLQYFTNNGAFTFAAPTNDGSCIFLMTNGASAGTVTFSGFSVGGNTGDALNTTNTNRFSIQVWRVNGTSRYLISAHQ